MTTKQRTDMHQTERTLRNRRFGRHDGIAERDIALDAVAQHRAHAISLVEGNPASDHQSGGVLLRFFGGLFEIRGPARIFN